MMSTGGSYSPDITPSGCVTGPPPPEPRALVEVVERRALSEQSIPGPPVLTGILRRTLRGEASDLVQQLGPGEDGHRDVVVLLEDLAAEWLALPLRPWVRSGWNNREPRIDHIRTGLLCGRQEPFHVVRAPLVITVEEGRPLRAHTCQGLVPGGCRALVLGVNRDGDRVDRPVLPAGRVQRTVEHPVAEPWLVDRDHCRNSGSVDHFHSHLPVIT